MKSRFLFAAFWSVICFGSYAAIPENAIPFILDSHVYIQADMMDSVPVSLIYDTGADRMYIDKDYMEISQVGKLPLKKAKARMGGAGNKGDQVITILIDTIQVRVGAVKHRENITPIINLREILGRHVDGMIGNNVLLGKPLMINFTDNYLLPMETVSTECLEGYTRLPAHFNDNRIDIECELKIDSVHTVKGDFRLDLGCGSTIVLTNETFRSMDIEGKPQAKCYFSNMGVGGDGTDVGFRAEYFKFLDKLDNVVISASLNTKGALSDRSYAGIIGNDILSHYDLIIDAQNEALYARRNGNKDTSYQHSSKLHMGYVDRTDISEGWIISSIYENGIAQRAGLEIGDTIISINGRKVVDISWEEQRKGLGLSGPTTYVVRKTDGSVRTYVVDIQNEII